MNLTNKDFTRLNYIFDNALEKTDTEKTNQVMELKEKVLGLLSSSPATYITSEEGEKLTVCLDNLHSYTREYSETTDIGMLPIYDELKKKMVIELDFLADIKDMLYIDMGIQKDYYDKELKNKLILELMEKEKMAKNKAESIVETLDELIVAKNMYRQIATLATTVKTKFDFYSKVLQMIQQSVGTARMTFNQQDID